MKKKEDKGYFVISLDFELVWGLFDVVDIGSKITYFRNTRKVIPKILQLFEKYEIHATWATVGMLWHRNWLEWEGHVPEVIPTYVNSELSAYQFGKRVKDKQTEEFSFAPDIIKLISQTEGQEVGSHTYSHYYCSEDGQTLDQFSADLKKAIEIAEKNNIKLSSLVFPRNHIKPEYVKICANLGIKTVRSNPDDWYWKEPEKDTLLRKVLRTGEAYNILTKRKSYPLSSLQRKQGFPLEQKASRFLRPFEDNKVLHRLKMKKVFQEMDAAADNAEVYHLWWHPHNFGNNPQESLNDLEDILSFYNSLRKHKKFESRNMGEINELHLDL